MRSAQGRNLCGRSENAEPCAANWGDDLRPLSTNNREGDRKHSGGVSAAKVNAAIKIVRIE